MVFCRDSVGLSCTIRSLVRFYVFSRLGNLFNLCYCDLGRVRTIDLSLIHISMNAVELCALSAQERNGDSRFVSLESARELTQRSAMKYDREGDEHYDILSAYQKSMRGSDPDAAIHYLARLLEAGDLPSACRLSLIHIFLLKYWISSK